VSFEPSRNDQRLAVVETQFGNMNVLAPILASMMVLPAFGSGVKFPSQASVKAKSPDGKWWVVWNDPSGHQSDPGHRLLLRSKATTFELRRFDRACDVLWSPDSSRIAVTDWLGSNLSDVFIYSPENQGLGKSLRDLFPGTAISEPELTGHCYFAATKWLDGHRLGIRVFGHTDEVHAHTFEHKYVFDFGSGRFEAADRKLPNQPHSANSRPGGQRRFGSWDMAAVADAGC
jgi:hypothetical protein